MVKTYPFYFKSTIILLGIVLLAYILSGLKELFIPLALSLLLSILLNPLVNFLEQKKIPHVLAISIALLCAFIFTAGIVYFLSSQIMHFLSDLPTLKQKFNGLFTNAQKWLADKNVISLEKQNEAIANTNTGLNTAFTGLLGTALGALSTFILLPVYTFMLLYYKTLILNFLFEIFAEKNSKSVNEILDQTKRSIQNYTIGLLTEGLIIATLNTTALLIIGVKYALLLGILGAILNVLPFIGGAIALLLPLIVATITQQGFSMQLEIMICYSVIQFFDNHFLIPWIVSSRVRINALISIVVVFLGGMMWGITGMFLSIPFTGVLKLIFDRIPELKTWGKLLGDEIPNHHKGEIWLRRKKFLETKLQQTEKTPA